MRTTLLAVTLSVAIVAPAHAFKFAVPPGWTDLSPGAPADNWKGVPPELAQQVRAGSFAFYAADVAGSNDGFMENVNATVLPGRAKVTMQVLDQIAADLGAEVSRQLPGVQLQVLEKKLVEIHGVTCGRLVGLMQGAGTRAKQVQYLLPGPTEAAMVTYSTTPEKFAHYEPIFDAAAAATGGLGEGRSIGDSALRGAIFGGVSAAIAVTLLGLLKMRRRKKA
jgi:hypothetical protein